MYLYEYVLYICKEYKLTKYDSIFQYIHKYFSCFKPSNNVIFVCSRLRLYLKKITKNKWGENFQKTSFFQHISNIFC